MLFEKELFDRAVCSRDVKIKALELIEQIESLSELAKRQGLLSLQADLHLIDNSILKKGLTAVVDGIDRMIMKELLMTEVLASRFEGFELLESMIIIDGVSLIQEGVNTSFIKNKLTSYLGVDSDLAQLWTEGIYMIGME